jgi:predicted MPP superfamily phosphohydrolase
MGPSKIIVTIIFGCAIIIICYGILHAQNIKIKKIPIKIASIPESWKGQKAVLISDLHLGQIYGKKFVTKICSEIKKINPAIIFIVGDIFDGVAVNAKEVLSPFSDIAVPLGIYFVTGNHEEFSSNLKYFDALRNTGIKILNDEMVNFKGMQIIGVDYKTTTSAKNFKNVLDSINIDSSKPSILLKHTPSHINITEEKGISLQLSGHTHRAQIFPFNFLTPLIYKGFDYGLKKSKNTQVLISSGIGTWGPPLRVGTDSEIVIINFV